MAVWLSVKLRPDRIPCYAPNPNQHGLRDDIFILKRRRGIAPNSPRPFHRKTMAERFTSKALNCRDENCCVTATY